jgi:putative aminopeptidase FrvX
MSGGARDRITAWLRDLVAIPGLSGQEDRVRRHIASILDAMGVSHDTDRLGNLIATLKGDASLPSVMLFAHMDQLGLIVRRIEPDGFLRVERLGGVPERALPAQDVLICARGGRDLAGIIASKSHHATTPEEKYQVVPVGDLYVDAGFADAAAAREAGVDIGTPVVYAPLIHDLAGGRVAGTSIDDRAGCAVLLEVARALAAGAAAPTVHLVFSVQEEFNLRGVVPAAQSLKPDIAIQLDLALASDTPDMAGSGEVRLGGGPAMSLYSFHGRGTLNGLISHPALVALFEGAASDAGLPLQRSARVGVLTETSYVQLMHGGIACIDLGFPTRHSHSAREVCDLADLEGLSRLVLAGLARIDQGFSLNRDEHT